MPGTFQISVHSPDKQAARTVHGESLRQSVTAMVRVKRAYDVVSSADGTRFLVERLWPRGLSKAKIVLVPPPRLSSDRLTTDPSW